MSLHELNIPDWAFLDGYSHEGDLLEGREVIIHTPTLTIIEFLQADNLDLYLNKGVPHQSFKCMGENLTAAVYKSLSEDIEDILLFNSGNVIINAIMFAKSKLIFYICNGVCMQTMS